MARATRTVLIADDFRESAALLAEVIRHAVGCRTVSCKNGREAVRLALLHRPDVVILDLNMPEMDGFEARAAISLAATSKMPFTVALTALSRSAISAPELALFDVVLSKPIDVDKLLVSIGCERSNA